MVAVRLKSLEMRTLEKVGRIYHVSIIIETVIFVSNTFVLLLSAMFGPCCCCRCC